MFAIGNSHVDSAARRSISKGTEVQRVDCVVAQGLVARAPANKSTATSKWQDARARDASLEAAVQRGSVQR